MALSRNGFDIFDVKEYNDLEIRVRGHSRSSKVTPGLDGTPSLAAS